tara:strand:+ start:802 stop:1023 length:222 start_codon:yes stop_codon:yes gene_type:complete
MIEFSYKNTTTSMVVVKCIGGNNFFLERVVFPCEIFTVMAPEHAQIEIWGIHSFGAQLEKRMRVSSSNNRIAA